MPSWTQLQIDLGSGGVPLAGYQQSDVSAFTGATARKLDDWSRKGILRASIQEADGHGTVRIYSFRDMVAARMLIRLTTAGITLQKLIRAVQTLRELGEDELAGIVLVTDGVSVYQCRSDEQVIDLLRGGQAAIPIVVAHALTDVLTKVASPTADLSAKRARSQSRRRRDRVA